MIAVARVSSRMTPVRRILGVELICIGIDLRSLFVVTLSTNVSGPM